VATGSRQGAFGLSCLSYRLTSNGYLLPVPLLDARRAIQTVRARARDYQIDPNRIVVIGFSAGGHLAALSDAVCSRQFQKPRTPSNALPAAPTTWCSAIVDRGHFPATRRT